MNRRELVMALSERLEVDRRTADASLTAFVEVITDNVANGETVSIPGFAKFARIDRPARMGRNPATGEPIKIAAKRVAKITPLKAFKDAALGTGAPTKKAPAKRAAAKKTVAKRPAAKTVATRTVATKKVVAKKAPVRAAAKKSPARRPTKATAAAKAPARKAPARTTAARKAPPRKTAASRR
jgi:DNA-binding protein HU-beta